MEECAFFMELFNIIEFTHICWLENYIYLNFSKLSCVKLKLMLLRFVSLLDWELIPVGVTHVSIYLIEFHQKAIYWRQSHKVCIIEDYT